MRDQRDVRAELRLNREIKKSARRDKLSWKRSNLEDLTDTKRVWKTIRFEKQTFSPKYFTELSMQSFTLTLIHFPWKIYKTQFRALKPIKLPVRMAPLMNSSNG